MAHMQKFKGSSATHIIGHCERDRGKEGYLKYRNGSYIDESRTHLNRSYPTPADGRRRLRDRLNQVAPRRRKDAVTMIDWVVTLPETLSEADEKAKMDFFRVSTAFLNARYGEQNLVGAYLHFDETTPHLHYCFVPVVTDQDGTERLCAKQLMSRKELNSFHKELDKTLEDYFDMPGLALTGITEAQGGNKSISELKQYDTTKYRQYQADLLKTSQELKITSEKLEDVKNELDPYLDIKTAQNANLSLGKSVPGGYMLLKESDALQLHTKAAAYVANQPRLENAEKLEKETAEKLELAEMESRRIIDKAKKDMQQYCQQETERIERQKRETDMAYKRQLTLNQRLEAAELELSNKDKLLHESRSGMRSLEKKILELESVNERLIQINGASYFVLDMLKKEDQGCTELLLASANGGEIRRARYTENLNAYVLQKSWYGTGTNALISAAVDFKGDSQEVCSQLLCGMDDREQFGAMLEAEFPITAGNKALQKHLYALYSQIEHGSAFVKNLKALFKREIEDFLEPSKEISFTAYQNRDIDDDWDLE